MNIYICIHTYIHTYMHTYIQNHNHTHTHMPLQKIPGPPLLLQCYFFLQILLLFFFQKIPGPPQLLQCYYYFIIITIIYFPPKNTRCSTIIAMQCSLVQYPTIQSTATTQSNTSTTSRSLLHLNEVSFYSRSCLHVYYNTMHCNNAIQYLDNKVRELDMGGEQQGAAPRETCGVAGELRNCVAKLRVAASQIHEQRRK